MWIITGASGFIGSQMISYLNQMGITQILAVDDIPMNQRSQTTQGLKIFKEVYTHDLWNYLQTHQAEAVKWVIHMGAISSTTETDWEKLKKQNLDYTKKLWTWCSQNQVPMVYASSAATYGDGQKGYSDETHPSELKALNLYGESKRLFDLWALEQKVTPPHWYGLKFFNVYGPGEYHKEAMASVVFKAYHQILKNGYLELFKSYRDDFKDGEQMRDFVYVKDITSWIFELTQKKPKSQIFNMGYGTPRTWLDLGNSVFKALGQTPDIRFIEMPLSIRDQYQYYTKASTTKWLAQGLSAPQWDLENGVADYIKTLQANNQTEQQPSQSTDQPQLQLQPQLQPQTQLQTQSHLQSQSPSQPQKQR